MEIKYNVPHKTLAAWRTDEKARKLSSSGGLASAISEAWIRKGGVVYGAAFVRPFSFQHIRCSCIEDLDRLRGSKYVQSAITGIQKLIDKDIENQLDILFIGTPCQVAGIKAQFGEKVSTIDIICHGTPKVEMLQESIPYSVQKLDYDKIDFRDCGKFQLSFKKEGCIIWSRPLRTDLYMKGFFTATFYRECCYSCRYARKERISDITLGDFWGLDETAVETTMEKGISLVLVNTINGEALLSLAENEIKYVERPLSEAVAGNKQLQHPMRRTWRNKVFKFWYPKVGFKWAAIMSMPELYLKGLLIK